MRAIVIADLHLSMYANDPYIEGYPERLFYLLKVLRQIADYAIKNGINKIIVAGDTFHTKSIIHSLAQSELLDYLRYYNGKVEFIIVDGNHDNHDRLDTIRPS